MICVPNVAQVLVQPRRRTMQLPGPCLKHARDQTSAAGRTWKPQRKTLSEILMNSMLNQGKQL